MLIEIGLTLAALLVLVPSAVLCLECLAALWGAPHTRLNGARAPRVTILMPAHNEALGIAGTLQALLPELRTNTDVIVIADNCTDATAEIARRAGVTVLARTDPEHLGKSYALAYGKEFLAANPPEVVVFFDADCRAEPGALDHIARMAYVHARPVQAISLLNPPAQARPTQLLSAFAFRVKNLVRPVGLARLQLPCGLTGSGMAFPWEMIHAVPLASGKLVEDIWLTVELATRKQFVLLDADTQIVGQLPTSDAGARAQRTRWEHGHLETILHGAPRLLHAAWEQKQLTPLWLMLDLCVPPLSLLVAAWGSVFALSVGAYLLQVASAPLLVSVVSGVLWLSGIGAAWIKYGRGELPLATLAAVPIYVLGKLPIYFAFLTRRQRVWERSEREPHA
jgi:hypothetical protein